MYGKQQIPCIGVSFGIERIFTILEQRQEKSDSSDFKRRPADVYIIAAGGRDSGGFLVERMTMARELWDAGIRAEYSAKAKPTLQSQFGASKDVSIVIMMGQEKLATGQVRLKEMRGETEEKYRGRLVPREGLIQEITNLMAKS